jgi:hypothetical protein
MTAPAAEGLTLTAPSGSHFEFEEVKTSGGTKSLGDVPILTWDNLKGLITHFEGEEKVIDSLDGTSLRVAYQSIARRGRMANKSMDEIAKSQIDYRPGKRGVSTPQNKAARAAKAAAEKVDPGMLEALLSKVASGELSQEELATLL